jgi:hypothetical protein
VTYFQRWFLKRTAPIDELIEAVLFSQPPIKMPPQIPLLPPLDSCMLSTISSLGGREIAKIEGGGFAL